jgi:hypothetical protein
MPAVPALPHGQPLWGCRFVATVPGVETPGYSWDNHSVVGSVVCSPVGSGIGSGVGSVFGSVFGFVVRLWIRSVRCNVGNQPGLASTPLPAMILAAALLTAWTPLRAVEPLPSEWIYIDNGQVRLGVKKASGAGIAWFSRSDSKENLLDHFDHGRLVQQSYYGKRDGSIWGDKPWSWNPVQGGDYTHRPSEVLELTNTPTTLHARIRPRNWAGGQMLPECEMEQRIRLEGNLAIIKFGFRYTGTEIHPSASQEVPATFINPAFGNMVIYQGDQPWTDAPLTKSQPGWPNESRAIPEGWAAWVNDQNTGVALFAPVAKKLTCYRFGTSPTAAGACSYFAPVVSFAVTPGLHFEYEAALALGTPEEMRASFKKLKDTLKAELPPVPASR